MSTAVSRQIIEVVKDFINKKDFYSLQNYWVELKNTEFTKKNKVSAAKLGEIIAEIAKKHDVNEIVFDRGPFKYHGILAALADSARAAGLQF